MSMSPEAQITNHKDFFKEKKLTFLIEWNDVRLYCIIMIIQTSF